MNESIVWTCPLIGCDTQNTSTDGTRGGKCSGCDIYIAFTVPNKAAVEFEVLAQENKCNISLK